MDFDDTPDEAAFRAEAFDWLSAHAQLKDPAATSVHVFETDLESELLHVKQSRGRTEDPVARQSIVGAYIRLQLLKFLGWRVQTAISKGAQPGGEPRVDKDVPFSQAR